MRKIRTYARIILVLVAVAWLAILFGIAFSVLPASADGGAVSDGEEEVTLEATEENTFGDKLTVFMDSMTESIVTMAAVVGGGVVGLIGIVIGVVTRFKNIIRRLQSSLGYAKETIREKSVEIETFRVLVEEQRLAFERQSEQSVEQVKKAVSQCLAASVEQHREFISALVGEEGQDEE